MRILAIFSLQGVVFGSLNARTADLQLLAGLGEADLGLVLSGASIGALCSFPFVSGVIRHYGTRRTILVCYLAMAGAALAACFFPSGTAMFVSFLALGVANSIANVAINVEADRVEMATGARLMNRCHGIWSVTFLIATSLAGMARGADIDPVTHFMILCPAYAALTLALTLPMVEGPVRETAEVTGRRFVLPSLAVLALVGFALGADMVEGMSRVWATIYLRDAFDVSAYLESSALPALILSMALARLTADHFVDRYGPRRTAQACQVLALLGMLLVVAAPIAELAVLGFAIAGLGAGIIYPLMISSAARLGDRPAAENVASVTFVFQLIMLAAPVLTGASAEYLGIRASFALLIPLLAVGWLMTKQIK